MSFSILSAPIKNEKSLAIPTDDIFRRLFGTHDSQAIHKTGKAVNGSRKTAGASIDTSPSSLIKLFKTFKLLQAHQALSSLSSLSSLIKPINPHQAFQAHQAFQPPSNLFQNPSIEKGQKINIDFSSHTKRTARKCDTISCSPFWLFHQFTICVFPGHSAGGIP